MLEQLTKKHDAAVNSNHEDFSVGWVGSIVTAIAVNQSNDNPKAFAFCTVQKAHRHAECFCMADPVEELVALCDQLLPGAGVPVWLEEEVSFSDQWEKEGFDLLRKVFQAETCRYGLPAARTGTITNGWTAVFIELGEFDQRSPLASVWVGVHNRRTGKQERVWTTAMELHTTIARLAKEVE